MLCWPEPVVVGLVLGVVFLQLALPPLFTRLRTRGRPAPPLTAESQEAQAPHRLAA